MNQRLRSIVHVMSAQTLEKLEGQGETHALDVKRKCCNICKGDGEFTDSSLRKHFKKKHPDVLVEYDIVTSRKFVECSSCSVKLKKNKFEKHKSKVHACRRTVNDSEETVIEDDSFENDVLQNQEDSTGQSADEQPYAINVPDYMCKLCKAGPMTRNLMNIHFEVRHDNVPLDVELTPGKRVKCSICEAKMFTKKFNKHKTKVHISNLPHVIGQKKSLPEAILTQAMKCKICNTEFVHEKDVENHFNFKHHGVPMEFDVVKSDSFVQCYACRAHVHVEHFMRHQHRCKHVPTSINREVLPATNQQVCQETYQLTGSDSESIESLHPIQVEITTPSEDIEEPVAIEVLVYKCKLCKNRQMHENDLKAHFKVKHDNAPPDFDVESGKRVKCSFCGAKMFTKNFNKHKRKVHQQIGRLYSKDFEDLKHPLAIDVMATKCKVCGAECVSEENLKEHFSVRHRGVSMEFIVEKSNRFVRCSACKIQVVKKHFTGHKQNCARVQDLINIGSLKVSQTSTFQVCQDGQETCEFNHPLVSEKLEDYKYANKVNDKEHRSQSSSLDRTVQAGKKAHTEAPRLFGCRTCDAKNILEQNRMKHHVEHHRPISNRQFEFKALDDYFCLLDSTSESKHKFLKCEICHVEFKKNHFQRHMRRTHSKSIVISEKGLPIGNQSEDLPNRTDIGRQLMAIKVYKCFACDARDIMEQNLVKHHLKKHIAIPIEINIFEFTGRILRERCGICQKFLPEGCLNEHNKRSHTKRSVEIGQIADTSGYSKVYKRTRVQHTEPVSTELHKCVKCKAVVSKDNIQVHRKNHNVPKSETLFKLIGIKNVIKCAACLQFIEPDTFTEHIKQHRSLVFVSMDGKPLLDPEPTIRRKSTQKSFVTQGNARYLPKYRSIYKCLICKITKRKDVFIGDTGLNGVDIQNHKKLHRNNSVDDRIFRLIRVKVKCNVCDRYMREGLVEQHMRKVHNWNYDLNFTQLYKCGCCDAHGISKRNLVAHHARMHNFSIDCNKFKVHAVKQKIVRDCCGKRVAEGRPKKHNLKSCLQRANAFNMIMEGEVAAGAKECEN